MFKLAPQGVSSLDVLVVEDDAVTRACLLQWLSRWGFRVEECSTLGDALARLSSGHEFAAVLLDQHLPDAAVETIAAQMKTQPWIPWQRIVAMTAARHTEQDIGLAKVGYACLLTKPVTTHALAAAISGCGLPIPVWRPLTPAEGGMVDAEVMAQLRNLLKRDLPKQLDGVMHALQQADDISARGILHTMSGAAALCAATELDIAVMALHACLQGDSDLPCDTADAFDQLHRAATRVLQS